VDYLVEDEKGRVMLTCMVACLFSRSVYTPELLTRCLESLGLSMSEKGLDEAAQNVQKLRWRVKFATGYDPDSIRIPERFKEVVTWKGPIDEDYLSSLRKRYTEAISSLGK
jgi:aldehyde:ferredoxin oxidoreductase